MADKNKKIELVDLKVTVENHIHAGRMCNVGDVIKVSPECRKNLEAAWRKQAEEKKVAK